MLSSLSAYLRGSTLALDKALAQEELPPELRSEALFVNEIIKSYILKLRKFQELGEASRPFTKSNQTCREGDCE